MPQPEKAPQNQNQVDVDIVTSNYGEDQPWVIMMEKFVHATFRDWVKQAGLHESRENDVLYAPTDSPKSLLKGNERNRVVRAADIALKEAYES